MERLMAKRLIIVSVISFMIIKTKSLPKFISILIFEDSLVDSRNNNYIITLGGISKANFPPYGQSFPNHVATGRFSNGLLMSDMLASALGIKDLVLAFLNPNLPEDEQAKGVCFASSGSGGYDDLTLNFIGVLPISRQLKFLGEHKEKLKGAFGNEKSKRDSEWLTDSGVCR